MLPSMWLAVPTFVLALDCAVYDDSGTGELALPEFVEALVAAGGCSGSRGPCLRPGVVLAASVGLHTWMQLPCVQAPSLNSSPLDGKVVPCRLQPPGS